MIGNGVVVDPTVLLEELDSLAEQGLKVEAGRLLISADAHLIMPYHRLGEGKYRPLGMENRAAEARVPSDDALEAAVTAFAHRGIPARRT